MRKAVEAEAKLLSVEVAEVRLDGSDVIIEFTTDSRPGCRFAFRRYALPLEDLDPNETVEMAATEIRVNLEEEIEAVGYGLPEDCLPGQLTWIG